MQIVGRVPYSTGRNYDGWIIASYAVFAVIALAAIYFASAGPGLTKAELVYATVLP